MGHTYSKLLTHIVFSTKDRIPYLRQPYREDVFAYMGGVVRRIGATALNIGGHEDHAHVLIQTKPSLCIAEVVEKIKSNSSKWIHDQSVLPRAFGWQEGYAALSVSESTVDTVSSYITNQEEHHRKISFREELVAFLERHKIAYDDKYIWR